MVTVPGIRAKFAMELRSLKQKSLYNYINVLNEKADTVQTMKHVFGLIPNFFKIGVKQTYQMFVGDYVKWDYIVKLKAEHGELFNWVIPYPGY